MRARRLASSVVLTVSIAELATLPGCDANPKADKPESVDKPPRNPPGPDAKTDGPDAKPEVAKVDPQPKPDTANPPPPEPTHDNPPSPNIDPPKTDPKLAADPKEVDPFPFPKNQIRGEGKTTMLQADGTCMSVKDDHCKPGKHCNPPKPKAVKCPPELRLPAATGDGEVYTRGDQTCWQRGEDASTRIVCPAKGKG